MRRLYNNWDSEQQGVLTFSDLVVGLNSLVDPDLMASMSNYFELYDTNHNGKLNSEAILQISEDLLYITSPWKEGYLLDEITRLAVENEVAEEVFKNQVANGDGLTIDLPQHVEVNREKIEQQQIERYLRAASTFIQRAFEYAQPEDQNC